MAAVASVPEPLDRLSSELNNVVGKIFKNAHQGDSKALNQAKNKAKDGIPQAQDKFQEALDELEKDLTQARMVLNRDLTTLRNKRAEREKAAGAARLQNGQPKAVKGEPDADNTAAQNGSSTKTAKTDAEAQQSGAEYTGAAAATASAVAATHMSNDIDSMFTDDLNGLAGLGDLGATGGQQLDAGGDVQMDTDALFGDGAMNLDGADFANLGGGNQDDLSALLPGLEKYVNQNQDNGGANDGQNANEGNEDFDLEALLGDLTGSGDASQAAPPVAASTDGKPPTAVANESQTTGAAAESNTVTADVSVMDFSNENKFDIDFEELTAGAADASGPSGNEMTDWFNFD